MRLVILGPQGSGKGTQTALLEENYGLATFAMGDALRAKAKEDSETGRLVKELLDEGRLVPNEITNGIIKEFVQTHDDWVVDGYPRNMGQAEFFDTVAEFDALLVLEISDETAVERLGGRRVCPKGHNYHIIHNPPEQEGVCDIDGEELRQREDDTPEAIKERLQIYHEKTSEVLEHYSDKVIRIDGDPSIEDVHAAIAERLGQFT